MKKTAYYACIVLGCFLVFGCRGSLPRVCIEKKDGSQVCLRVEVAATPEQRSLGLMYRKSLKKDRGMLFLFESDTKQSFTMRNTFIPLDMIFIDRSKKVAGWVENTRPLSKGPYSIDTRSRYVLETNAFFRKNHGISKGDRVLFFNIPGL